MFIFFGGKGGVGKTTCAAAFAVALSARARVLVASTDPAHSLGDALGVRLRSRPRQPFPDRGRLRAVELDAPGALRRWLADHRPALGELVERGTWLDREDVDALLGLSMPGIDEAVALLEITALARQPRRSKTFRYDAIVIDTAPTGHTLRLLTSPDSVSAAASFLDALNSEHRLIRERFARVGRRDAADRLIDLVASQAGEVRDLLCDPGQTRFNWVLLPEELSVAETEDGLAALGRARIPLGEVFVNRVIPPGPACPICDRRRADQQRILSALTARLGKEQPVRLIADETSEPRGLIRLRRFGRTLLSPSFSVLGPPFSVRARTTNAERRTGHAERRTENAERRTENAERRTENAERRTMLVHLFGRPRLIVFAGKGGVGKTTCAAAAAISLARLKPDREVLLLSTDPAHSLADVLRAPIGDRPTAIPGGPVNLMARELDAPQAFTARRSAIEAAFDEIAATFGTSGSSAQSRAADFLALAPPGIDELFGITFLAAWLSAGDRPAGGDRSRGRSSARGRLVRTLVIDSAPTGHALRLLEMPDIALQWVHTLMRILLKYRSLVGPGKLAKELVDLSRSIRNLQALIRNQTDSRFVVVTRPEELARLESERLAADLKRLRLPVRIVIANAVTVAPGPCSRCRTIAATEGEQLSRLGRGRLVRDCVIIQTPLTAPPPRGVQALERWASQWTRAGRVRT